MKYKPSGVCSREINFEIDQSTGVINNVEFIGGCAGNASGLSNLLIGMQVDEVIKKLDGIHCGFRPTSCPDQLARALKEWRQNA